MAQELERVPQVPGMHHRTMKLIEKLKDGRKGDVLTDELLGALCGHPVSPVPGGKGYNSLRTAIRYCTRNHGVVWERESGAQAIRCLNDEEIVSSGRGDLRRIRRRTTQTIHKLGSVKLEGLPVESRPAFHALTAQTAALRLFAETGTTKKLEHRTPDLMPDPKRLLEAIIANGK